MRAKQILWTAGALLTLAIATITTAAPIPAARTGFVVHEWGTFSSFSGSDGRLLKFHPTNADLPTFVHRGFMDFKSEYSGLVSLETPVLYFYTDKPLTAAVRAEFPSGVLTEWFPQAERTSNAKVLSWTGIRVQPGDATVPPTVSGKNHYYAAREVDAAPVDVVKKNDHQEIHEHERFLFYRGVGDPKTPMVVTALGGGEFSLRVSGDAPIAAALLMEVKEKQVRFQQIGAIPDRTGAAMTLPAEWTGVESVRAALVGTLVQAGLFDKEARAMVKTWESAWFGDDGTRVLYVLPNGWTDRTLPLNITPTPDTLVRVMVGRHDVLTPEREQEIDALVKKSKGTDKKAAEDALAKLGRFAAPARDQAEKRLAQRR